MNAAEEVFAQHGFDGARIDAIAKAAGYNKSLIFQYYGDKLGIYDAVIRRLDKTTNELQAQIIVLLLSDDAVFTYDKFRALLKKFLHAYFDYLVENPRFMRMFLWEMAEGWQTMAKIISQRDRDDVVQFQLVIQKAQAAGLLQPGFEQVSILVLLEFLYPCYLAIIPLMKLIQPGEDVSSATTVARAREYLTDFIIRGLLANPQGVKT